MAEDVDEPRVGEDRIDERQAALLRRAIEAGDASEWNEWRRQNPDAAVWLQGARVRTPDQGRVELRGIDLRGARLARADLRRAVLVGADLGGASLREPPWLRPSSSAPACGQPTPGRPTSGERICEGPTCVPRAARSPRWTARR